MWMFVGLNVGEPCNGGAAGVPVQQVPLALPGSTKEEPGSSARQLSCPALLCAGSGACLGPWCVCHGEFAPCPERPLLGVPFVAFITVLAASSVALLLHAHRCLCQPIIAPAEGLG